MEVKQSMRRFLSIGKRKRSSRCEKRVGICLRGFSALVSPRHRCHGEKKQRKFHSGGYFLHCVLVWSVNRKPYGLPGASVRSLGQRRSRTGLTTMFFVPAPVGRYVSSAFSLPSLVRHACLLSRCIRHGRPLAACRARYTSPFLTVPATCWRVQDL